MKFEWKGVMPALTTKFTHDDKLDLPLFEKNIRAQLSAGVDGLILGGTLGEASVLSKSEKEELIRFTLSLSDGKVPVILNIAEGRTSDAIQLARDAERLGAQCSWPHAVASHAIQSRSPGDCGIL
jgi:4-hydroxy-tetrahydrodipicolinate synthase